MRSGSLVFTIFGLYGISRDGVVRKLSPEENGFIEYFRNDLPEWRYTTREGLLEKFREDCNFYDIAQYILGAPTIRPIDNISESCYTRKSSKSRVVFLWGDSHVQQLNFGLSKVLPQGFELLQVASSGCVINLRASRNMGNHCDYSNWFAHDVVKRIIPETIIVGQRLGHNSNRMREIAIELKRIGVKT